ncbi:putative disease resistance RPP13-like protein 1 isoform X2 [Zingiber officinale]|uniref:putative disease resistance RPP13-like protein 1 isoform X2 n=1 Tax=Zingiber officinale TaxID=94328 RepID=UPI001C4A7C69|nr:putative disease resistance RPP13-like protein 1 isoform X2 [Zingiber officinale]
MAGGGFLSSMFTTMVDKLHSLAAPSATSSSSLSHNNIEREMSKLTETMRRIQAKLDDSEEENHAKSHSEKLWLSELKDVAYDAEDVVEEYEYETLRSKQLHENSSGTHEDELANKAAEIRKRFDEITKEWKLLKLPTNAGKRKRSPMLLDMNRETGSLVVESDVLGRAEEKDMLVKWLLSEDDTTGNGVSVIAVIGMGGLGKTTLAQLVYNDQRVKSYFDLIGWVCVSENFHVVSLTEKILQSFAKVKVHEVLDELQHALREILQGKKFLLILDDVWNEEFTLNLNCLPFDVCWPLFKRVTLGGADKSLQPHLEHLGRKIVDKCKGLPLAVKVLGGALRNKEDIDSWKDILENEMWESEEINKGILPALKISYDCMPIQLKRCFQYLPLFPKDTSLDSEEIVRLWMSQGLLPLDGDKRAEDIGRNYIKRLAERSLIHLERVDTLFMTEQSPLFMRKQSFSLHDLVHDLAQYIAQDEYLCVMDNKFDTKKLQKFRHLSFNVEYHKSNIEALRELKLLRTLFIRELDSWKYRKYKVLDDLFQELKYIRTLVLDNYGIEELPYSLGNLKLLRYLSIKDDVVESIPESICSLYNLQTLDLTDTQISELPRQIGNLINLRHLLLPCDYFGFKAIFFPSGIGNMINLQTLRRFNASCEKDHCDMGELNSLMKLSGHISISELAFVNIFSNSKPPLKTKKYIDSLELCWRKYALYNNAFFDYYRKDEKKAEWQLEYLEPHVNLENLEINSYPGIKFVGWVSASSFTKLTRLHVEYCKNSNKLPPLGQLPSLEELKICRMDGVQCVGREFCSMLMASPSSSQNKIAFPSLKDLIFRDMTNWEAWDGVEIGDFPSLHSIRITGCCRLIKFPRWPFLSSVEKMMLESGGVPDVSNFHSLTNLTIMSMSKKNSKWMSKCYFPTLQHLILLFSSAESVHLSHKVLPSLKTLEIRNSPTLRVVAGLKNLTSLNSLIIEVCPNLEFKGLPATLEQVKLDGCRLFEQGFKEQQHMRNVLMIEPHNSDDEVEEKEEMDVDDEEEEEEEEDMDVDDEEEEEEEMDGDDDDNNDDNMD